LIRIFIASSISRAPGDDSSSSDSTTTRGRTFQASSASPYHSNSPTGLGLPPPRGLVSPCPILRSIRFVPAQAPRADALALATKTSRDMLHPRIRRRARCGRSHQSACAGRPRLRAGHAHSREHQGVQASTGDTTNVASRCEKLFRLGNHPAAITCQARAGVDAPTPARFGVTVSRIEIFPGSAIRPSRM
jgi:hypothetical protein